MVADGPDSACESERPASTRVPALALAVAVIVADQATKWWATSVLAGEEPIDVLGDLLRLRLAFNAGAAFSIGAGFTWVFTIIAAAAVAAIGRTAWRARSPGWSVALGLLLGGATTHLLDRLFRPPAFAQGHVVDFIDYAGLFVGNVADIALVGGALLLFLLVLRGVPVDGRRRGVDAGDVTVP